MHKIGPDNQDVRVRGFFRSSPAILASVWVSKEGFVKFME